MERGDFGKRRRTGEGRRCYACAAAARDCGTVPMRANRCVWAHVYLWTGGAKDRDGDNWVMGWWHSGKFKFLLTKTLDRIFIGRVSLRVFPKFML